MRHLEGEKKEFSRSRFFLSSLWLVTLSEEELKKLKDESHIDSLKQELEKERCKRIELEQKVNEALKLGWVVLKDFPIQFSFYLLTDILSLSSEVRILHLSQENLHPLSLL